MSECILCKKPDECGNIDEVRSEIDRIDSEIVRLLALRFGYVREVVKYKDNTPEGIEATDRRKAVIDSRRLWAQDAGLNPDVIGDIYNTLIDYFVDEERKIIGNHLLN